jgi:hypothetical protein
MTTRYETDQLKASLIQIVQREHPISVRGVFYRAVSAGLFPSTDRQHYARLDRVLIQLRRRGTLPNELFTDSTRIRRTSSGYDSVGEYVSSIGWGYSRNVWLDQPVHLEIFTEKDAMTSILSNVVSGFNLTFNVLRGFSAEKILYSIGQIWRHTDKPILALYLGDHDPSGLDISLNALNRLRRFAGRKFEWIRLGATKSDLERLQNLTVEVRGSDPRAKAYIAKHGTRSLEVDAIESDEIRTRLRTAVKSRIDQKQWEESEDQERREQEKLRALGRKIREIGIDQLAKSREEIEDEAGFYSRGPLGLWPETGRDENLDPDE